MNITVNPNWWQTLFDEIYLVTDARSVCNQELTRREIDLICQLLPIYDDDKVLDLCGGHGRHSLELCRRGFSNCTVVDYSRTLLREGMRSAAMHNLPVHFVQGDARHLHVASDTYDHVFILGNSLGYVAEKDSDISILQEAYRVLKPGGWLLLDVADGDAVIDNFSPSAWHEIGEDVVVCRNREIQEDRICARELVISKSEGMVRDCCYSIRLFEADKLTTLSEQAGFTDIRVYREFSPRFVKGDLGFMNHRMLLVARCGQLNESSLPNK